MFVSFFLKFKYKFLHIFCSKRKITIWLFQNKKGEKKIYDVEIKSILNLQSSHYKNDARECKIKYTNCNQSLWYTLDICHIENSETGAVVSRRPLVNMRPTISVSVCIVSCYSWDLRDVYSKYNGIRTILNK